MPPDVAVRTARPAEYVPVVSVLEGALLDVEAATVEAAIGSGDVLVAVAGDRVVGALLAAPGDAGGAHVEAVAVRPRRRREGTGRALVAAAADRYGRLTATFRAAVRPFYEACGFDVEPLDEDRFRASRPA